MQEKKDNNINKLPEQDMWTMEQLQPTCGCSQEEIDKWLTKVNALVVTITPHTNTHL